jgi:deoxyribonuclease V
MKLPAARHRWSLTPKSAIALQRRLQSEVVETPLRNVCTVAGADVAFTPDGQRCVAGLVVWDPRTQKVIEQQTAVRALRFPYVPGLLSFREVPAVLAAARRLCCEPDVFLFDGQGRAHPRRFGLACHAGLLLDRPAIGCAKSRLIGEHRIPGRGRGAWTPLTHPSDGARIGAVLRTRTGVKPVFVSVGHRCRLIDAIELTLGCCSRFRLPEPARLAHQLVTRVRREV